jgi:3-oxoacyl-[acyl-carrier-protein] synthase II
MQRTFHRVVITGMGAVTPIGGTVDEFWRGLIEGRNGIHRLSIYDPEPLTVQIAGEVRDWNPELYMDRKVARRTGRFAQFALGAATQALRDSRIPFDGSVVTAEWRDQIGVVMATSGGAFEMGEPYTEMMAKGSRFADPFLITRLGQHMGAARVGRELGLRGPNTTINTACASGTDALGHAMNMIRLGHARAILTGGAEALITPLSLSSMGRMGALSHNNTDPEHASRPFDADRDGFILGEGAGVLLVESEESALERGAIIHGELAGVGWAFDATDDTSPDAAGQALAMTRAFADAGIAAEDVDYINCHGTSTPLNDRTETAAIKLALGDHAYRIPMSSTKSMTGHLAAGAGGIEAVAAILTMRNGRIPPTINYTTPDPDCDLDIVPNESRPASLRTVISNSFGLGGQNACAVFRRYEG